MNPSLRHNHPPAPSATSSSTSAGNAPTGAPTTPTKPNEMERLAGVRLLLIDDEQGVLRALTMVLQAFKCNVSPHNRPEEGVATLKAALQGTSSPVATWDVIVCDLRMPGMSGLEVLTAIRATGSTIPFILMSGHATATDIDEARAMGVDGFLPKPFSPPQLAAEVVRLQKRPPTG